MSIVSDFLSMFTADDTEVVKKTLTRIDEQDKWNDVFSTKLIELLDNVDGLKKQIRERMRRVESVQFAESVLLDEAAKTEALNTKLAATEKALDELRQEFQIAKTQYQGAQELRKEADEKFAEAESHDKEARIKADEAVRDYLMAEQTERLSAKAYKESEGQLLLSSRKLQEASQVTNSMLLEATAKTASLDTKLIQTEKALETVRQEFQAAKDQYKGAERICNDARETFRDSGFRYTEAKELAESAAVEHRKAEEAGKSSAEAYRESERQLLLSSQKLQGAGRTLADAAESLGSASKRLESAENIQVRASEAASEAKGLLDQSTSSLNSARSAEEKATADIRAARQVLEASERRLTAATQLFRKAALWTVSASVLCLVAVAWMVWSGFRPVLPLWEPSAVTALLVIAGALLLNEAKREA